MDELKAQLILSHIPQLGAIRSRQLIHQFGSASAILQRDPSELQASAKIPQKAMESLFKWESLDNWKRDLDLILQHEVFLVSLSDSLYPPSLRLLSDAPLLLYVKGSFKIEDHSSLAIVGTRAATPYGQQAAESLSQELAQHFTIVSGLARGIDTAAHRGALHSGRTLAIIGSGLANIYPKDNKALAKAIESKGAIISELPMFTAPEKYHFPRRNRIISGMTAATLLIEAPLKSGAMSTAEFALSQSKPLFTIPGRIDIESFKGNLSLLKSGKARLIDGAEELLKAMGISISIARPQHKSFSLTQEEQHLMDKLPSHEFSIEELIQQLSLPLPKLSALLMSLSIKQMIKELPGKLYQKK